MPSIHHCQPGPDHDDGLNCLRGVVLSLACMAVIVVAIVWAVG